jgi:Xaa-Pro dipeptidase
MIGKILSILNNGNNHLDAIALVPGSNFQYLTGGQFFLMERPLVLIISKTYKPIVILPVLEISNFVKLKFDAEIIEWQDSDGYQAAFEKAINLIGMNFTLGIEGQLMRAFEMQAIQKVSEKIIIKNCHKIISKIRLIKEKDEISNLVKAIEIAEKSLENTLGFVREGLTEIQIKNFLMQQLLENGADAIAFEAIVLAGENSALCHGHSRREYIIKKGDSLLFDFGATVNGYHSDITRTFFIGQAVEEDKNMYETVLKANTHGRKITKPDLSMNDLDDQVLRILEESPYKEYVVHKTGHGLGMDVHEDPYVMRGNFEKLEKGMVITIEPGLYRENHLGIRIEDDVLVTEDACKSLTTFNRDLRII